MNKKLLTAAIGAALVAGPMLAQADVKLYGKLHVSVDYLDARASTQPHSGKTSTVSSNASRWGISVSEKLGGGLTAIGKLEQGIDATGETAAQGVRNRYVGLKGKFGQVLAGTHDTPLKEISRTTELFPEYVGDSRNLVGVGGLGWDLRPANAIRYDSPSLNGFVANYLHSTDSTATTGVEDNRRRLDSIGVKYAKGPLYVAYARESHRVGIAAATTYSQTSETGDRLGASYNFGAFKLVAMWQDVKDLGGTVTGDTSIKRKTWGVGGAYTAGNNVFKAQYYKAGSTNATAGTSIDNSGAKMWAIGWDHLFSKTTKAYIAYAKTDNDAAGAFTVNGNSDGVHGDKVTTGTGGDPAAWSVGMIVDF